LYLISLITQFDIIVELIENTEEHRNPPPDCVVWLIPYNELNVDSRCDVSLYKWSKSNLDYQIDK
jgi:hypothetical protein